MIYRRGVISVCILIMLLNCSQGVTAYISEGQSDEIWRKDELTHEELLLRRKIVDAYLSETGGAKQDWVETYHLRFSGDNLRTANKFDDIHNVDDIYETNTQSYPSQHDEKEDFVPRNPNGFKNADPELNNAKEDHINKVCDEPSKKLHIAKCQHDRSYFVRWVAKLVRKIGSNKYGSMCLSLSPELLTGLNQISEDFDIVTVDELLSSLISNATFHDGSYRINIFPSFDNLLYYSVIIVGILLFSFFLHYFIKNHPYITLFILILAVSVYFHAHKHKKSIMAQKHATISRVMPENCINTLTRESGIFDHIKEFIRHSFYREDCKKYYEAVMIDPSEEISIPVIIADLVFSVLFQFLKPLAPVLNYFVKEISDDMSFIQKLMLIPFFVFIFFIVLLLLRYKINLPFFMGSFEPASAPRVGSHAEDVKLENSSGSPIVNVNVFPNANSSKYCVHKNDVCGSICNESNKIDQLHSDIEKREMSRIIRGRKSLSSNEGEIVNFLCDKHECKNLNPCNHMQINSDKRSYRDSVGDISDHSSCKSTEQTLYSGDKSEDDLKKQILCYTQDLNENSNSLDQIPVNLDKKSDSDCIGNISSKSCNEQTEHNVDKND